jgi:UDP-glucose 4-epimerase
LTICRLVVDDVREPRTVNRLVDRADVVFHLAGLGSVETSLRMPKFSHEINASATIRLLDRARRSDTRVVVGSTARIYDYSSGGPIDEAGANAPRSPVAIDALAVDRDARRFDELYDMPVNVLRYANVYGPRQEGSSIETVVSRFFDCARSGKDLLVHGDGTQVREVVHVGEAFNVGAKRARSVRALATMVRAVQDRPPSITHVSPRPEDEEVRRLDIQKARTHLG